MKYNEAQQKERIANSLGTLATGIDVLILIVLGKFVSPLIALVWFVIMCVAAKAHYDHLKTLADAPSEAVRVFDARKPEDIQRGPGGLPIS